MKQKKVNSQETERTGKRPGLAVAQAGLGRSRVPLDRLVDFLPDPAFAIDTSGTVILWNKALEDIWEIRAGDMLGRGDYAYAVPFYGSRRPMLVNLVLGDGVDVERQYTSLKRRGDSILAEGYVRTPRGKIYIMGKASPIYDAAGKVIGAIETFRDISERVNRESEILRREAQYRDIFENVSDLLYLHDLDGRIIESNLPFKPEFGYSKDDLEHVTIQDLMPGQTGQGYRDFLTRLLATGMAEGVTHLMTKDGQDRMVEYKDSLVRDELGRPVAIRGSARDITERIQALQALRQSEERFRQVVEHSPFAIAITSDDGTIEYLNRTFVELLGYTREDIPTIKEWFVRAYPDPEIRIRARRGYEHFVAHFTTEGPAPRVFPVKCKDGRVRTMVFSIVIPEQDRLFVVLQDITEQEQAQNALRESEHRHRFLAEHMHDVIWILNLDLRYEYVSPSVERARGYTPQEILNQSIDKTLSPESFRKIAGVLSEELERESGGKRHDPFWSRAIEAEVVRKDGSTFWCEITASFLRDEKGEVTRILGSTRDISERKKAQEALRQSEERFRAMAEASPVVFWMTSTNPLEKVIYVSPAFEKLFGYACEELYRNPVIWFKCIHPEDKEQVMSILKGTTAWTCDFEFRIIRPDSALRWVRVRVAPILDHEGNTALFSGIAEDITGHRHAEQEKKIYEERLARAQKMEAIGTLAGGIAHDFNNILSAVIGYTELAMDDVPAGGSAGRSLREVLKAGDRAKDLVSQILTFSRQVRTEKKVVKVHLIVKEAMKLLRSSIPSTIAITQNIDPHSPAVFADPTQIHQVVMNLCTNAYQAMMDTGGTLAMSLAAFELDNGLARGIPRLQPGPYLHLSVSDTGCGMDRETLERIFEPFFTTKEKGKGTGLGLATVHGIVSDLSGSVTVSSTVGEGSTFHVYLPACHGEDRKGEVSEDAMPRGSGERILLVDDESAILVFAENMIEQLGYSVATHSSSVQALDAFSQDPFTFDLVITDQTMPLLTGSELAAEILAVRSDIPIILVTGFSESISAEQAREQGISVYLEKPFTRKALAEAIHRALFTRKQNKPD